MTGKWWNRAFLEGLYLWVLAAAVLLRTLMLSSSLMVFEGWDEYQHLAVSYFYAQHQAMPILDGDPVPRQMYPFLRSHPHPAISAQQLATIGVQNYADQVWQDGQWKDAATARPPDLSVEQQGLRLYQAQHGPLFYQIMAKIGHSLAGNSLTFLADWGRVFNSLCGTLLAVFWFLILRRVLQGSAMGYLAYLALALFAANSTAAYNSARVANDACANLLVAVALYGYVRYGRQPTMGSVGRGVLALVVGLICGLAVLGKATAIALLPVLVVGVAVTTLQAGQGMFRASFYCGLVVVGYALAAGGYHLHTLSQYGGITAMQEGVVNREQGRGLMDILRIIPQMDLNHFLVSLNQLHTGGWSFGRPRPALLLAWKGSLVLMATTLLLMGGVALYGLLNRTIGPGKSWSRRLAQWLVDTLHRCWELLLFAAVMWCALLYHSINCLLSRGYVATNPWYAISIFPVLLLVLLLGPALLQRWLALAWAGVLFVVFNLAFWLGTYRDLMLTMTGKDSLIEALELVGQHHGLLHLPVWILVVEFGLYAVLALLALLLCLWSWTRLDLTTSPPAVVALAESALDVVVFENGQAARQAFTGQGRPAIVESRQIRAELNAPFRRVIREG